jgi:hypothetical protein
MSNRRHVNRRARKFKRMIEKLDEVQFLTLPSSSPGKTYRAANVMFDSGEITFIQGLLKHILSLKRGEDDTDSV